MINRDETFAFSPVRSVNNVPAFEISIYPNPVSDELNLTVSDWKQVKSITISNILGVKVYSSGSLPLDKINVKSLPAGVYSIRITNINGEEYTRKIICYGRPILDWTLDALPRSVDRVVVVVHYLAERIEGYLADSSISPPGRSFGRYGRVAPATPCAPVGSDLR